MRHRLFRYSAPGAGLALLALVACGAPDRPATEPGVPWTVTDARPDTTDGLRILVLHDMEGLSGQDDWHTFEFGDPAYPRGRELLVADVNAVIDGLFAGGATQVHVVDGHGSGNPEPDLLLDELDARASHVFRDEAFDAYFDLVTPGAYDAVAVVGMHAKTGSGGFASHTYTLGIDFIINGQSVTETELVALSWGRVDVPVIFASGDDRLARDLATMPWIEYVIVKRATSASTAEPRPVADARSELRAGARRAAERVASAKVMKVQTPVRVTLRAVPPASLAVLDGVPGIEYHDNGVSFVADSIRAAYEGLQGLVRVAARAYPAVLFERLRERPDWDDIVARYNRELVERWLDYESGRWQAPERPEPADEGRRYHGFR